MSNILKTLRLVQWALLGSVLACGVVGELAASRTVKMEQTLSYIFSSLAVGIVGTIFVVRRTIVLPAATSLAVRPNDSLSLNHWKTGYLTTYGLCDALAVFGLVLRLQGSALQQSLLFYVSAFALLVFFRPSSPLREST